MLALWGCLLIMPTKISFEITNLPCRTWWIGNSPCIYLRATHTGNNGSRNYSKKPKHLPHFPGSNITSKQVI